MEDVVVKREQSPSSEPPLTPTKKIKTEEEEEFGPIDFEIKCEIETEEMDLMDEIKDEPSTSSMETQTEVSTVNVEKSNAKCGPSKKNMETQTDKDYFFEELGNLLEQIRPKKKVKGTKIEITDNHILQFNIHLMRGRGAPKIWRRFQVPATYTFREFHIAIQKAMGWKSIHFDYHLHSFSVINPATGYKDSIVTTEDVPLLDEFENPKDENLTLIKDYFYVVNHKGKYVYDFGIWWEHEFVFECALVPNEALKYPRCVEGAKACPPEDGVLSSDEEYDSDEFNAEACFND